MSAVKVRMLRSCVVNVFGLQERYTKGQLVTLRPSQAEMLVSLGDAEILPEEPPKSKRQLAAERKALAQAPANKAETGPAENKAPEGVAPFNAEEEEGEDE